MDLNLSTCPDQDLLPEWFQEPQGRTKINNEHFLRSDLGSGLISSLRDVAPPTGMSHTVGPRKQTPPVLWETSTEHAR